jgi:hypothetical protein
VANSIYPFAVKVIQNHEELIAAVDEYLDEFYSNDEEEKTDNEDDIGKNRIRYPIGDWDVSRVDDLTWTLVPNIPYGCDFLGMNEVVTYTITDAAGNAASCKVTVTAVDTGNPSAACVTTFTAPLDAASSATIAPGDINNGSSDNCDTDLTLALSKTNFACSDVPAPTPVTLTATDDANNSGTCTANVIVVDTVPPVFTKCAANLPVQLTDASSTTATLTINPNVATATDNCGAATITPTSVAYTCADVGTRGIAVTATDVNGNTAMCQATVFVSESVSPVATCQNGPITLKIQSTSVSITPAMVDNGSSDNCGPPILTLSRTTFTCADLGPNPVTLTATDRSGNVATCNVIVMVVDEVKPDAVCVNVVVPVGTTNNGAITLTAGQVLFNGEPADDNCGETSVMDNVVAPNAFNCADAGQSARIVTVTATDGSGNFDTCTSQVTIVDQTIPTITACPAQTVVLNSAGTGTGTIDAAAYTATDNCAMVVAKTITPASFTCASLGRPTVTATFTDDFNNVATCSPVITVTDTTVLVITCPASIAVTANGEGGSIAVPVASATATDNCGSPTKTTPPVVFDCANRSLSRPGHVITATDVAGNTATCTTTVTIVDNVSSCCLISLVVFFRLTCCLVFLSCRCSPWLTHSLIYS